MRKNFIALFIIVFLYTFTSSVVLANPKTSSKKGVGLAVWPWDVCKSNDPTNSCILKTRKALQDMGITWFYNWTHVENSFKWFGNNFEFVPMVSGAGSGQGRIYSQGELNEYAQVAKNYPGRYWLIWNEPEDYRQLNIKFDLGAKIYKPLRDAIKGADPNAKLIVGNFLYMDPGWLNNFRNEYKNIYGNFPEVEGWGFHHYMCNEYNIADWRNKFTNLRNWLKNNGEGDKEFWLTEFGCLQSGQINLQIMRDGQLDWLEDPAQSWITRYAWFSAGAREFSGNLFTTMPSEANFALSHLGQEYAKYPTNGADYVAPTNPSPLSITPTRTPTQTTPTITPTLFPCPNREKGNINCDTNGKIDIDDLNTLLNNWTTSGPAPTSIPLQISSDLNNDNKIDEKDLNILLLNWNGVVIPTITPSVTLPPPLSKTGDGGFYYLDNWDAPGGPNYMTGGTVLLDWRDFEPIEGQYRWDLLTNHNGTYISWLDIFHKKLSGQAINPRPIPGQVFYGAHQSGKKLRFKLRVTEGAVPLWLYGGEDKDGISPNSYGTICAYKTYDQVYAQTPDCNPQTNIVIAITYPLYPTKEDNAEPVWWNPIFQEKLKRTIIAIGEKIESDPLLFDTIEFVEASLGSYGETILYGKSDTGKTDTPNQKMFRAAGYTNAVYSKAVQDNLHSYYLAFKRLPIAVSLGTGLYAGPVDDGSGVNSVLADFYPKIISRYGSRLYPKFAGFGTACKSYIGQDFKLVCPDKSRCIYESFGGIGQWQGWPWGGDPIKLEEIFNCAVQHKAYIIMMWTSDLNLINSSGNSGLLKAFENTYPKLEQLGLYKLPPAPTISP